MLQPYAEVITSSTIDVISNWILQVFPGGISNELLGIIRRTNNLNINLSGRERDIKYHIMNQMISYIITAGYTKLQEDYDIMMNPWHILEGILADNDLRRLFQSTTNTLPVGLFVNNQNIVIDMTMEQVYGLLVFSNVADVDFYPSLFNQALTIDMFLKERFEYPVTNFNVFINRIPYGFNTSQFMQGFQTGAQWAGVDHHRYWSDLTQINLDDFTETHLTF